MDFHLQIQCDSSNWAPLFCCVKNSGFFSCLQFVCQSDLMVLYNNIEWVWQCILFSAFPSLLWVLLYYKQYTVTIALRSSDILSLEGICSALVRCKLSKWCSWGLHLRCGTLSLGNWCARFQGSVLVSYLKDKMPNEGMFWTLKFRPPSFLEK
jgi:hypothetical protein